MRIASSGVNGLRTSSRNVDNVHCNGCAFLGSGVPNNRLLVVEAFSVKHQEDQPAKVSDGFGQKVYDEGFVKVISSVW